MKFLFSVLLMHLVCLITLGQGFDNSFQKYPPSLMKEDLDFIFKKYGEVHPEFYKEVSKEVVDRRLQALKSQIDKPLNRIDFMNLFAPVLFNIVKDGHNYVNGPNEEMEMYIKNGGVLFPVPIIMRENKIFINSEKSQIPYNSEVLTINGVTSKAIISKILAGYNAESEDFAQALNSPWFSSSYWYSYGNYQSYAVEFKPTGSAAPKNIILKGSLPGEIDSLRKVDKQDNYSYYEIPEVKTAVIQFNLCEDLDNFRPFCDRVFKELREKGVENLVIDIRNNPGGTTRLGEILYEYITEKPISQFEKIETKITKEKKRDFIQSNKLYKKWFKWYNYLYYPIYVRTNRERKEVLTAKNGTMLIKDFKPEVPKSNKLLFKGNVYLLTSRKTYSAAAILAATFKYYKLGTIVGEETGEPTTFTANTVEIALPNTKLVCSVSCAKIYLIGTKDDGRGVIPDIEIKSSDYAAKNDVVLDHVKSLIKK